MGLAGTGLGVDMYDSKGTILVWPGVASKTFDTNAKPDKQHTRIWQRRLKLLGFPRSRRPLCLGFSKLLY